MRRFVYLFKRVLTHGTLRFNTVRCEQKEQQVVKIDVAFSRVTTVNDTCVNDQCEMDVHARLSKQSKRSRSFYRDEESEFSFCPLKVQRFDR